MLAGDYKLTPFLKPKGVLIIRGGGNDGYLAVGDDNHGALIVDTNIWWRENIFCNMIVILYIYVYFCVVSSVD